MEGIVECEVRELRQCHELGIQFGAAELITVDVDQLAVGLHEPEIESDRRDQPLLGSPGAVAPQLGLTGQQPRPRRRIVLVRHPREELDRPIGLAPRQGELGTKEPVQRGRLPKSAELLESRINTAVSANLQIGFRLFPDRVGTRRRPESPSQKATVANPRDGQAEAHASDPEPTAMASPRIPSRLPVSPSRESHVPDADWDLAGVTTRSPGVDEKPDEFVSTWDTAVSLCQDLGSLSADPTRTGSRSLPPRRPRRMLRRPPRIANGASIGQVVTLDPSIAVG